MNKSEEHPFPEDCKVEVVVLWSCLVKNGILQGVFTVYILINYDEQGIVTLSKIKVKMQGHEVQKAL